MVKARSSSSLTSGARAFTVARRWTRRNSRRRFWTNAWALSRRLRTGPRWRSRTSSLSSPATSRERTSSRCAPVSGGGAQKSTSGSGDGSQVSIGTSGGASDGSATVALSRASFSCTAAVSPARLSDAFSKIGPTISLIAIAASPSSWNSLPQPGKVAPTARAMVTAMPAWGARPNQP